MRIFMAADPQFKSERETFRDILKALVPLSDDYHLALNVSMPSEMDMLICSSQSIVVVEVKAWQSAAPVKRSGGAAGSDFFNAESWQHDNNPQDLQPNPMRAVRAKTQALVHCLETDKLKVKLPCFPILVFPNMPEPPEGLVFLDGFGKAFFKRDLTERLPEFISSLRFANANPARYPLAKNYRLTPGDIRERILPGSYEERVYKDDLFAAPHGAGLVANRFQFAGPVIGEQFRGMAGPMAKIRSRLSGHFYISGMRRMGKTSLLKRAEELRWQEVRPFSSCDYLFLDFFSDITDDDARNIYENVLFQLCSKLRLSGLGELGLGPADTELRVKLRRALRSPGDSGFEPNIDGTRRVFERYLLAILKKYREENPGRRAVLVFDEFSDVLLRCWDPEEDPGARPAAEDGSVRMGRRDVRFITSLLKKREVAESCSIVVIGKPYMIELDRRMKTELFSVMPAVDVDFLSQPELRELVAALAAPVKFADEALDYIWLLTAGHPFYVQLLCNVVMSNVGACDAVVDREAVKAALKEVLKDDSKFEFEFTDYDLETVNDGDRDFVRLSTTKLVACLSEKADDTEMVKADLVKACRGPMRMDERAIERVLRGLTQAQVLAQRSTADGQSYVGFKVPMVHVWCRRKRLFEECKRFV